MLQQAVFLVGGLGTRLRPLSARTPKPLLAVADRPFLDYLILEVLRHGLTRILLLAGHLAEEVEVYAERWRSRGIDVRCIVEPEPAGTGGALYFARSLLDERFLLFNGDSLFAINILDLITIAPGERWIGKMALRTYPETGRYGRVEQAGERITGFHEKAVDGPDTINGGIYLFDRHILDYLLIPPCSLERDILPSLVALGLVFGRVYEGAFVDIGVPEDYRRAQAIFPALLARRALFLEMECVIAECQCQALKTDPVWRPGSIELIKRVNDRRGLIFLFTGRHGHVQGVQTEREVGQMRLWLNECLQSLGAHVDAVYDWSDAGGGGTAFASNSAVPNAGMITKALMDWNVDPRGSLFASPRFSAVEAAKRSGLQGILVPKGGILETPELTRYDPAAARSD